MEPTKLNLFPLRTNEVPEVVTKPEEGPVVGVDVGIAVVVVVGAGWVVVGGFEEG